MVYRPHTGHIKEIITLVCTGCYNYVELPPYKGGLVENLFKTIPPMLQFRGSHSMALELQKRLSLSEREKIAVQLEQLIDAASVKDGYEVYLIKKIKDSLGV